VISDDDEIGFRVVEYGKSRKVVLPDFLKREVFLSKDEDVFIASEGDIVDRRYRIVRIVPSSVEVEDMLNSHRKRILLADSGTIGKGL